MSEARVNNLSNESNSGGPTISGITTFSSPYFFIPPVGNTAERPENAEKGSIRFNTETKNLEYYRGDEIGWVEVEATSEELDGGHRGLNGGGDHASDTNAIDYITISTLGNAVDFGDLTQSRSALSNTASSTRAVFSNGFNPGTQNTMDYAFIPTKGDAVDFGNSLDTIVAGTSISNGHGGLS